MIMGTGDGAETTSPKEVDTNILNSCQK